jgi:hypothetical protein
MRFFNFSRENNIDFSDRIRKRWLILSNGFIADSQRNNSLVWKVGVNSFEDFFSGLEKRSGQSLGRRLAHSSSESEEWLISDSNIKISSSRNLKKWSETSNDWQDRGLGSFELIDNSDEIRILINHPSNGPMCAGIFSAIWELSSGNRFRFRWNQNTSESLMLSLSEDNVDIPSPQNISYPWFHKISSSPLKDDDFWDTLMIENSGVWSLMGERMMMVHQDLILRFESYFLPYLDNIHEGRKNSCLWRNLDNKKANMWTIFSDTMREIFFDQGHHIIISKEQDWITVARRHLGKNGLGCIDSINTIDDFGGVEISTTSCFHPAIFCGILSGCWERAYGRNVKSEFRIESGTNILKLTSLSEISHQ